VDQLVKGLTKDQVQYLLGTPLLNSPIHQNRWDYFYSVKVGETVVGEKKLSLLFDINQRLDTWVLEETTLGDS
jgi:outer membrane protein assembly factor BamE